MFYTSTFFRMQTKSFRAALYLPDLIISLELLTDTLLISFFNALDAPTFETLSASLICFLAGFAGIHRSSKRAPLPFCSAAAWCSEQSCDPSLLHPRCVKLPTGSGHESFTTTFEVRARNNVPSTHALYWILIYFFLKKRKIRYIFYSPC